MEKETWEIIKRYYNQIADLEPTRQQQVIDQLREKQPKIAEQLQILVEEDEDDDSELELPAASKIKESKLPQEEYLIGQVIGKYELKYLIGIGGMGKVFLADRTDLEAHQQVAIKLINAGYQSELYQKRFVRERKILSKLNHPHITRIYDGGITQQGAPFIVMEYVEGMPLLEYIRENKLSLEKRLELFLDLCSAVAYAHRNFIMHRDLKPGNILVTNYGIVKVIDFGIAKILEEEQEEEDITLMGYIPLTPAYASPEQLQGEPLTASSDIYSLGIVLYELLTGNKPFSGNTQSTLSERFTRNNTPTKPSSNIDANVSKDINSWKKGIKGDLDNIVLKALKEDPSERYASVDHLADDIERYQNNFPVLARPDSLSYRVKKYVRRNKALVALAAVLVLSLVAGVITTTWQARIAANERDQARQEAEKAREITNYLIELFNYADPDREPGMVITSETMLAKGSADLKKLSDQPELQAEMYMVIGELYGAQNLFDSAVSHLNTAVDLFEKVHGEKSVETAEAHLAIASAYAISWNPEKIIEHSTRSADIFDEIKGPDYYFAVQARSYIGSSLRQLGKYQEALKILLPLHPIMDRWENPNEQEFTTKAIVLNEISNCYNGIAESENQRKYILFALDAMTAARGETNQNNVALYTNLGHSYLYSDILDSAEFFVMKALEMGKLIFGDNPSTRIRACYCKLSLIHTEKNNFEQALKYAELCREETLRALPGNAYQLALALDYIADVYSNMGDFDLAIDYFNRSLQTIENEYGQDHQYYADKLTFLGEAYFDSGDLNSAANTLQQAHDIIVKVLPDEKTEIARAKQSLANALELVGDLEGSNNLLIDSYSFYQEALGEDHEYTRDVLEDLIESYNLFGQEEKADELKVILNSTD